MGAIKHAHSTTAADGVLDGRVQPSWWNEDHQITGILGAIQSLGVSPSGFAALDENSAAIFTPLFAAGRALLGATSYATMRSLLAVATLSSPAFTDIPTAPTAALGLATEQIATTRFVSNAISNLVGGAPELLNTLNEFAAAIGSDPNFAATTATAIGNRLRFDDAQSLTLGQQYQGRYNLGIGPYSNVSFGLLTVGLGGTTGSSNSITTFNGASGAGSGSSLLFGKNGSYHWWLGHHSAILATGTFSDMVLYNNTLSTAALRVAVADNSATFGSNITVNGALSVLGTAYIGGALTAANLIAGALWTQYPTGPSTVGIVYFDSSGTRYIYNDGTSFVIEGRPVRITSTLSVTGSISIGGGVAINRNSSYTYLIEPAGANGILLGGATDPSNYHYNNGHVWYSRGATSLLMQLDSGGGLTVYGSVRCPTIITGSGGTGSTTASVYINGGSGAGGGPLQYWSKNTVAQWYQGCHSAVSGGGTDSSMVFYNAVAGGYTLRLDATTNVATFVSGVVAQSFKMNGGTAGFVQTDSSGNLYTSPTLALGSAALSIAGLTVTAASGFTSINIDGSADDSRIYFKNSGAIRWLLVAQSGGCVFYNGAATSGVALANQSATSWSAVSDARIKDHVETLSVLERLDDFRAVRYRNKLTDTYELGVIAQEQVGRFDELVVFGDNDSERSFDEAFASGMWGFSYDRVGVIALMGVKELRDETRAKIAALEAEIELLKKAA